MTIKTKHIIDDFMNVSVILYGNLQSVAINSYLNLAYQSSLPCRELYFLTIRMPVCLEFGYFILQISLTKYRISRKVTYSLYFFHRILEIHSWGWGNNLYSTLQHCGESKKTQEMM